MRQRALTLIFGDNPTGAERLAFNTMFFIPESLPDLADLTDDELREAQRFRGNAAPRSRQVTGNGGCHPQGVAWSSMRATHFPHQYPRRPGATRRSGDPGPTDRGAPPTRVA